MNYKNQKNKKTIGTKGEATINNNGQKLKDFCTFSTI
jgi:hypothetical protein